MPQVPTPKDVVEALMHGISRQAWSELHLLFAEDAVVDYPLALPKPARLEGRAAIQAYFARTANAPMTLTGRDMVVRLTEDPEVVVAEWDYDVVTPGGAAFTVSNITVTRVRGGMITARRATITTTPGWRSRWGARPRRNC